MERRHVQFALIAFAIIFGSQLLQTWLFPRPPGSPQGATPAVARGPCHIDRCRRLVNATKKYINDLTDRQRALTREGRRRGGRR